MNKKHTKKWFRRTCRVLVGFFLLINVVMAFNAWKFTHFYDDPSLRNPPPASFWMVTKNILFGQNIPKTLNDSTPSIPFEKVILTNKDGLKLEAWSLYSHAVKINRTDTAIHSKNTIIMFHGYGNCKSTVLKEAYTFLDLGYDVFMIDFRAHGGSEGAQCTIGMKEKEDVRMAYTYIKNKIKQEPVLWGVSMGAATIAEAIDAFDLHPSKIILEMPFGSMYEAVKGFLRIKKLPQALAPFITFWGGILNGEWAFKNNPTEFVKKITCPVLLQWGAQDPRVTKTETDNIFASIGTDKKKLVVYENSAHESLCTKEYDKWKQNISEFLQ